MVLRNLLSGCVAVVLGTAAVPTVPAAFGEEGGGCSALEALEGYRVTALYDKCDDCLNAGAALKMDGTISDSYCRTVESKVILYVASRLD